MFKLERTTVEKVTISEKWQPTFEKTLPPWVEVPKPTTILDRLTTVPNRESYFDKAEPSFKDKLDQDKGTVLKELNVELKQKWEQGTSLSNDLKQYNELRQNAYDDFKSILSDFYSGKLSPEQAKPMLQEKIDTVKTLNQEIKDIRQELKKIQSDINQIKQLKARYTKIVLRGLHV